MSVSPLLDAAGRRRSPATLPGFHAGRPPRNKGARFPADPPPARGDHRGHARGRRRRARGSDVRVGRRALASGVAHQGGAVADRGRPRRSARGAACAQRQGRQTSRGRHGPLGVGAVAPVARRARRVAGGPAVLRRRGTDTRPAVVKRRGAARSCGGSRPKQGLGAASRRTSYATLTPSNSLTRALP